MFAGWSYSILLLCGKERKNDIFIYVVAQMQTQIRIREVSGCEVMLYIKVFVSGIESMCVEDQYQYLGNCPPTPPLTQRQSIDDKLGLMLS